jgi:hypothetical protein
MNGIENRAEGEKRAVKYLRYEIYHEQKGEVTYWNSGITNHELNSGTVRTIADCGRARWKIEHEHNNGLKHHGYNLEHHFGHGNELFCLLNQWACLFHGIQVLAEDEYRKAHASFGRKDDFFWALRYETARYFHENWHDLFLTVECGIAAFPRLLLLPPPF